MAEEEPTAWPTRTSFKEERDGTLLSIQFNKHPDEAVASYRLTLRRDTSVPWWPDVEAELEVPKDTEWTIAKFEALDGNGVPLKSKESAWAKY
jgi:hypothetical protein